MNVTFHIIIDATETKKGGIICKDIYYNSIYISKCKSSAKIGLNYS